MTGDSVDFLFPIRLIQSHPSQGQRSHLLPKDLIVSWCFLPTPSLAEALKCPLGHKPLEHYHCFKITPTCLPQEAWNLHTAIGSLDIYFYTLKTTNKQTKM